MNAAGPDGIELVEADEALRERIKQEWGPKAARHMHLEDGFSIVALDGERPVGLVSVQWGELPPPLPPTREGYVDIIEVVADHRRRGIARRMMALAEEKCRAAGVAQIRAWSTDDRAEAIAMWKALGFALCPVTHCMWGPQITGYFAARRIDG